MPSEFTGNIIQVKISLPASTLGSLVNQLSIGMKIRVSSIMAKWKYGYTVYRAHENKQVTYTGYGRGGQEQGNGQSDTKCRSNDTQKYQE